MQLYAGLDLHSRNTYIGILDQAFNRVFKKRVGNQLELIVNTLEPFRKQLKGLVVESTFNWYWLVDGLMDAGYQSLHLANPSAIRQYEGLKHIDDQHDAFFLAQLLILGILPQGYIYPKKQRPLRDLARKRLFLVQHKTAHILSLQSLFQRCCAIKMTANQIRPTLLRYQDDRKPDTNVNKNRLPAVVERRAFGSLSTDDLGDDCLFNSAN
jgi:hypothetical protein